ncbi:DNA methyltransferase [Flavobacterium sp. GNP002]
MALSWNEIKDRAVRFSKEWENTTNEEADAKSFLDAFFDVFGITRKKIGTFEHRVKKLSDADGYIDLLWKGTILVEMKSRGKNLNKAFQQAIDYTHGLKQNELPKYVLVCDFYYFRLYDTEEQTTVEFTLNDLVQNVQSFGYLLGYQKKTYKEQDPANIKAAELMGKLHDRLEEIGYEGHPLEVYLVRILFCLFAEDTTIFDKQQFQDFIENRTADDGSDLAGKIQELFQVLNTPKEKRFKNLDEQLNDFPYVNGKLFEEVLPSASFDTKMRLALLDCCYIDWSKISPAIFGSMFQSVMNPKERRNLGAHYTSESNILKLIKPLFLDELWTEFESIKGNKNKLPEFHKKISQLKFLDPACGCGNFLVITYRELRLLELEVLRATYKSGQGVLDIREIMWLDVDMMCGIEYEEFPARIAEVAMWLMDHQMNMMISNEFGQYFARLPLKKSARIVHGNALEVNWEEVISKKDLSYIIGNPPFIGSRIMNKQQKEDLTRVFNNSKNVGELDYVTGWYLNAAKYIQNTKIKVAFVSTNSIVQGLQTAILWGQMINKYDIKIHFAHKTFKWSNEAKGNAAVYCVIVGFANFESNNKSIFEYEDIKGEAHEIKAKNINPYLVDGKNIFVEKKSYPICNVPKMNFGNMPADGGELLFTTEEKNIFIEREPQSRKYFRKILGSQELINNIERWCLWLEDIEPNELKKLKLVLDRVQNVKKIRENSSRPQLASIPHLFAQITQPKGLDFIIIPSVSSERRKYIPIGFENSNVVASNLCLIIPNGNLFHFGVLMSQMHMAWVKTTCGRLKSDFRYSKDIVYNNYPWPENPTEKQIKTIEEKAQNVLDVRALFPASSLADLYDPLTMPPALVKAHNELDKAVDAAYSKQTFSSEAKRMEFLFELYEKYTAGLFVKEKKATKIKN